MDCDRLRLEHIDKSFVGVQALKNASFSVRPGEVHALVGENGAGKSTLIKIAMGAYSKDAGEIYVEGSKVEIPNPIVAQELGLSAVYQDVMLAPHLSVAENIFLGRQPRTTMGAIDFRAMYVQAKAVLSRIDLTVDPKTPVKHLTSVQAEMVAIAKAISKATKILILDEPTALLAAHETAELFRVVRKLCADGLSVIYISHRLEEVFELCDRVTVMRDGQVVRTLVVGETDKDEIIRLMVGRRLEEVFYKEVRQPGPELLRVEGLTRRGVLDRVSFAVHAGEIVGMFGLVGSGRTEVVRAIFGADRLDAGEILVKGRPVKIRSPFEAIRAGIGLLPEDRKNQGLALLLSVASNINLASYDAVSVAGVIRETLERWRAQRYVDELAIRTPGLQQRVKFLSGGNQQKVVVAKWLCQNSEVLMFDEPTAGVDVGAKAEIFRLLGQLVKEGKGLIFISSYLPEVLGVSDRLVVLSEGRVTGIMERAEASQETVLRLATATGERLAL